LPRFAAALPAVLAFALAAALAWLAGVWIAGAAERITRDELERSLTTAELPWVRFEVDGLNAHLTGAAPSEHARLAALRAAAEVVGPGRLSEAMTLPRALGLVAPVFRIEAMRRGSDVSLVGLVPEADGTEALVARFAAIAPEVQMADMLQTAAHAEPPGWGAAVDFAARALARVEVGRVSVGAGRIEVHALVPDLETRRRLEADLRAVAPRGSVLALDLVAPRPVLAPFLFRLSREGGALRLEACSADSEEARAAIERVLRAAGLTGRPSCQVGLGTPSPRWVQAVEQATAALMRLPAGSVTLSDLSVRLEAPHDTDRAAFDRAAGRLEADLPPAFTLSAALSPPPPDAGPALAEATPEFRVSVDQEGRVVIGGRLPDARLRQVVATFARARFGSLAVAVETRLDPDLPADWTPRVLAGLEALSDLAHGTLLVTAERLDLAGTTGDATAAARLGQTLANRLGGAEGLSLRITYDEAFDPAAQEPTPERCAGWLVTAQAGRKITFAPGSARINDDSAPLLDDIAEVLRRCGELPLEVAGHTDSQGRAETNLILSQSRAEAVVAALGARAVLTGAMVARGYGPERPIGDNATEEGREANRRIELVVIQPQTDPAELSPDDRQALESDLVIAPQTPAQGQTRPALRPPRN
jgi:OmpA-OmpF porin, OOP family